MAHSRYTRKIPTPEKPTPTPEKIVLAEISGRIVLVIW